MRESFRWQLVFQKNVDEEELGAAALKKANQFVC